MIIYVDASVIQTGNGTKENPFKTIQEAAAKALPGDEVIVAPGLYREAVNPIHAGTADKRITYRSAIKGQAHITGSEAVKDWENVEGTVWKAVIPNGIFGDYNPFTTLVSGDWFIATFIAHTGDVYLNEKSMYEVTTLDKVKNPQKSTISWDPDFSVYTWYAEQDEANNQTIIYANFHEKDPNKENVEISVRRNCSAPSVFVPSVITAPPLPHADAVSAKQTASMARYIFFFIIINTPFYIPGTGVGLEESHTSDTSKRSLSISGL